MDSRVGLSLPTDSSVAGRDQSPAPFARRIRAAFVVGAGLAALAVGPSLAIAGRSSGNDSPTSFLVNQSANSESGDRQADPGSAQPGADKGNGAAKSLSSRAVCVKLCDGSFFPLNGGGEATCASQCPGAPTQVFFLASGSDQIEDSAARNGQRYTALPVAFRYRTTVDNTCTCGAKGARENATALLEDPTLRKGDLIMTADGIRVFNGAHGLPYDMNDFVGIAQSTLPREERDTLTAMDRVNARSPGAQMVKTALDAPAAKLEAPAAKSDSPVARHARVRVHPSVTVSSSIAQRADASE
jgi:Protein of unknown function (DUF2865)